MATTSHKNGHARNTKGRRILPFAPKQAASPAINWQPGEPRLNALTWTSWLPVGLLDPTEGNPAGRTLPGSKTDDVPQLERSFRETGGPLMSFTCVGKPGDRRYQVADGNRRRAAVLKVFGPDKKVLVLLVDSSIHDAYRALNSDAPARKLTGTDKLAVYLVNPGLLTADEEAKYAGMEAVVGREVVAELVRCKLSWKTYGQAVKLAWYCGVEEGGMVKAILAWMTRHSQTCVVEHSILRMVKRRKQKCGAAPLPPKFTPEEVLAAVFGDRALGCH
jgi:hypothetical protein